MLKTILGLQRRSLSGTFVALLYLAFGLTDLLLSMAAFALGVGEANPLLAWFEGLGLFMHAKLALTAIASLLIAALYSLRSVRPLAHLAVTIMGAVDAYHIWALHTLLAKG